MLKMTSVRERLYLGPCLAPAVLDVMVKRFRTARESLLGVYDTVPMLKPKYRTSAKSYLDQFYKRVETLEGTKKALLDGCETHPYM